MLIDVSSFIPAAVLLGLVFLPALLAVGIVSAKKGARYIYSSEICLTPFSEMRHQHQ